MLLNMAGRYYVNYDAGLSGGAAGEGGDTAPPATGDGPAATGVEVERSRGGEGGGG